MNIVERYFLDENGKKWRTVKSSIPSGCWYTPVYQVEKKESNSDIIYGYFHKRTK